MDSFENARIQKNHQGYIVYISRDFCLHSWVVNSTGIAVSPKMSRKLDRKLFSDIEQQAAWNYDPWERENKWGPIIAPITVRKQFLSQRFEEPRGFTELREQRSECEEATLSRICRQKGEKELLTKIAHKPQITEGCTLWPSLEYQFMHASNHQKEPLANSSLINSQSLHRAGNSSTSHHPE